MSHNRLQMNGLDELRRELRQLPEDLAREASAIILAHAEDAGRRVRTAYPEGPTGNLKHRVTVNQEAGRFGTRALVRSRAPHAWIFEKGTRDRRTHSGANRGRMPAAPESQQMIPIVIRVRRLMVAALIQLVEKAGLTVTSS